MERYTINNFEQMVTYAEKNTSDLYTKYNNISKLMYTYGQQDSYGQFSKVVAGHSREDDYQTIAAVDNFLQTVIATDVHIRSAAFVFADGTYQDMSRVGGQIDFRFPFPSEEWSKQMTLNPKQLVVFPTHQQDYYPNSGKQVLTFARNLIDVVNTSGLEGKSVGTIYIDVTLDALDEIFKQLKIDQNDGLYVTEQDGRIIYSNRFDRIGELFQASDSKVYHYVSRELENSGSGWSIVGEVNKKQLFSKINEIKRTIAIVVGLCIVSLVVVAMWFSKNLSNPIRTIIRHMSQVESGNFDNQVEVRTADEIGMLARGFNKMTDRLQSYIEEVYVAQIKQKQAELYALKSQIRPHYLYNTLEVIRMSAVANDDEEVGDMILSLSKQLKYVLDYGDEMVTLRDEKSNIEQYFKLMVLRYGEHRLAIDFRIDRDLLDCKMPKLSIQPLVENAVYHGIMPKQGKGTIRIAAEVERSHLVITVDDDGIGMDEQRLDWLRAKLAGQIEEEASSGGIGVKNVNDRIHALYGNDYGLQLSSTAHIGTSVRMIIPLHKEMDKG
ncbi:cache domain-containing sensor histidine kinase [Paenibacillus glycanilyticus]|uniref:cache domain-containing sensor histidine kinase n=1 Tax=Paenibacillus glycanilyticus TaxID=126569 RepID=UPI001F34839E|nr:sensor histidine kinase [Paenibacillus glycanilyticus]